MTASALSPGRSRMSHSASSSRPQASSCAKSGVGIRFGSASAEGVNNKDRLRNASDADEISTVERNRLLNPCAIKERAISAAKIRE